MAVHWIPLTPGQGIMTLGAPRMPTAVKLLQPRRGMKTKPNTDEPVFDGLEFPEPTHLSVRERRVYDTWFKMLKDAGVLKPTDVMILAAWSQTVIIMQRMGVGRMPLKTLTEFRQLSSELGLTPASRAKLKIPKQRKDDPIDRFFDRPANDEAA